MKCCFGTKECGENSSIWFKYDGYNKCKKVKKRKPKIK